MAFSNSLSVPYSSASKLPSKLPSGWGLKMTTQGTKDGGEE
jgi:hypothetical protein